MAKSKSKKKSPKKSPPPKVVVDSIVVNSSPAEICSSLGKSDAKVDLPLINQAINEVVVSDLGCVSENPKSDLISQTTKVAIVTDLVPLVEISEVVAAGPGLISSIPPPAKATAVADPGSAPISLITPTAKAATVAAPVSKTNSMVSPDDSWTYMVKGQAKKIQRKGESFILPSGEVCVKIPNEVIERNRRSWDCFVLGQFYSEAPAIGTLHSIANGIWSKHHRDITVSKMEGNAFLFRIPNVSTRNRVINQRLWSFEGQTMFVAKWEPGIVPAKPELTSAPIWLELRNVPLQFFHEEGLERIAGLVGHPKFLHPSTANKTNLEVAKVFTIIDPRKPLPEAVNVQFDSGEIRRVEVSSPWMPPICAHCKEVGHSLKRCKTAPITCSLCNSTSHGKDQCSRAHPTVNKKKARLERAKKAASSSLPQKGVEWIPKLHSLDSGKVGGSDKIAQTDQPKAKSSLPTILQSGELSMSSGSSRKSLKAKEVVGKGKGILSDRGSEVEEDSSDVYSEDSEEEGELREEDEGFTKVVSKRHAKIARGLGPTLH